ncbi:phage recombination protein Bet [Phyllobacterium ifriqiyense]|uniref:Phage recombination protein Bet n=1 Tax=Phyllobacterium ifriqiyense TaxID=314238 RepID=A0ABU0S8W9_9HYPH|nr:phage recombination protein Bet [Phyllobacterium ifriqiyense]MDQ0996921.1 phage recombination protein Bet [Phyllobacterium ifriqiyense]
MNAIANIQPSRMPIPAAVAKEFEIQPAEWRVLVEQIFPTAKSIEAVMMALAYCRKRNLDIFKKPVHIVPMWSSAKRAMVETVWPGIAEIRTTATRTKQYAGIDAVEFGPMIERSFSGKIKQGDNWEDVNKTVRFPEWASVVVYRMVAGVKCSYHAKVFWEETYATVGKSDIPNDMWAKRARGQLDKCVEAAALRKAFPEELGNTYAAEEMEGRSLDTGDVIDHVAPKTHTPPKPPSQITEQATQPDNVVDAEVIEQDFNNDITADGEVLDDTEFFERLEESLAVTSDEASIEEVWTEADPMARFQNDETSQSIALAIKKRALKRVGG